MYLLRQAGDMVRSQGPKLGSPIVPGIDVSWQRKTYGGFWSLSGNLIQSYAVGLKTM
jgi:hypothetical protein